MSLRGGNNIDNLEVFYMTEIASPFSGNFKAMKEYIFKVCTIVSTIKRPMSFWETFWTFNHGQGRKMMLTMIRTFLNNPEYYDPLGLRGLTT